MTTKLTLSVDKRVVQKAKRYARTRKKSLSEIVATYLDYISSQPANIKTSIRRCSKPLVISCLSVFPTSKIRNSST